MSNQTFIPIAYGIADAVKASGLSRTTLYELIASGTLPSRKVAGRRLIPADALKRLIVGEADDEKNNQAA
jgi:excisionase family DNA binding protein